MLFLLDKDGIPFEAAWVKIKPPNCEREAAMFLRLELQDVATEVISPPGVGGFASAVSADGHVIVGFAYPGSQKVFRWTESGGMSSWE